MYCDLVHRAILIVCTHNSCPWNVIVLIVANMMSCPPSSESKGWVKFFMSSNNDQESEDRELEKVQWNQGLIEPKWSMCPWWSKDTKQSEVKDSNGKVKPCHFGDRWRQRHLANVCKLLKSTLGHLLFTLLWALHSSIFDHAYHITCTRLHCFSPTVMSIPALVHCIKTLLQTIPKLYENSCDHILGVDSHSVCLARAHSACECTYVSQ